MNHKLLVALAAFLPMTAACDQAVDAAESAREAIENIDVEKIGEMAPEAVREAYSKMTTSMREAAERLTDEESVQRFMDEWSPKLDQLRAVKDKLGANMPGWDEIKEALAALRDKLTGDKTLKETVAPLVEKIDDLMN